MLTLLCLTLSCAPQKRYSNAIDGTWAPIRQEIGGNDMPVEMFQAHRLIIEDTNYTMHAESIDKGTLTYADGKMDIYGNEGVNNGNHFTAIYKIEGDQLTICYNLAGDAYPEEFETMSSSTHFLAVFERDIEK